MKKKQCNLRRKISRLQNKKIQIFLIVSVILLIVSSIQLFKEPIHVPIHVPTPDSVPIKKIEQPILTQRVKLQEPTLQQSSLVYWKITKKQKRKQDRSMQTCLLINSANIFTIHSIINAQNIFKLEDFGTAYIIIEKNNKKAQKMILQNFKDYTKTTHKLFFKTDFYFANKLQESCQKLIYMFGNFKISTKEMAMNIAKQAKNLPPQSLYFTSKVMSKGQIVTLPNLAESDLEKIEPSQFYSYVYIFDTEYLGITTPINFAYYTKYTLQQIILLPLLILYQSSQRMLTSNSLLHGYQVKFRQFKQFAIESPNTKNQSVCFISYPTYLRDISTQDFIKYAKSIQNQQLSFFYLGSISIIVYLPYQFKKTNEIIQVSKYLKQMKNLNPSFRIKLRIIYNTISPGYAIYDSVYSYCPNKSLVISSRHNIIFHKKMVRNILMQVTQKYHYFTFNLSNSSDFINQYFSKQSDHLYLQFLPVQIFKSDLFKMIHIGILKCAQVQFYETQIPFIRNMMETVEKNYNIINQVLATIYFRKMTQKQLQQIKNAMMYTQMKPLPINRLFPYKFNSLHNPALRRNAPEKIPRIIHQIWLSKDQISKIRMLLFDSIVKANSNFTVKLWRLQNITKQNFPITYDLVFMILQKHKTWKRSLFAMISAIMRYQLIVQFGGIYIDFKFQGRKPLDNFLKYQGLYLDVTNDYYRFDRVQAIENGAMGGIPNSYHLKITLTQLITQKVFNFWNDLPWVTGSFVLRRSYSQFQIFTQIGTGDFLLYPNAEQKLENFCGGLDRQYDQDQQVFEVKSSRSQKNIKIGFPCKLYPQVYIYAYTPLSATWVYKKKVVD